MSEYNNRGRGLTTGELEIREISYSIVIGPEIKPIINIDCLDNPPSDGAGYWYRRYFGTVVQWPTGRQKLGVLR
jgi:hypothetical protein